MRRWPPVPEPRPYPRPGTPTSSSRTRAAAAAPAVQLPPKLEPPTRRAYDRPAWRLRSSARSLRLPSFDGPRDRQSSSCERHMAKATGANSRATQQFSSPTARPVARKSTGKRRTASAAAASRSSVSSTSRSTSPVYRLSSIRAPTTIQVRRLYRVIPDPAAARSDYVRVVDDSGEDYLYPASCFIPLELPQPAHVALRRLAR